MWAGLTVLALAWAALARVVFGIPAVTDDQNEAGGRSLRHDASAYHRAELRHNMSLVLSGDELDDSSPFKDVYLDTRTSSNRVSDESMRGAIDCLAEYCQSQSVGHGEKIRCIYGPPDGVRAIAYFCNDGSLQSCTLREMNAGFKALKVKEHGRLGYVQIRSWFKIYGFDRYCPASDSGPGTCEGLSRRAKLEWPIVGVDYDTRCGNDNDDNWSWTGSGKPEPKPEYAGPFNNKGGQPVAPAKPTETATFAQVTPARPKYTKRPPA